MRDGKQKPRQADGTAGGKEISRCLPALSPLSLFRSTEYVSCFLYLPGNIYLLRVGGG